MSALSRKGYPEDIYFSGVCPDAGFGLIFHITATLIHSA